MLLDILHNLACDNITKLYIQRNLIHLFANMQTHIKNAFIHVITVFEYNFDGTPDFYSH